MNENNRSADNALNDICGTNEHETLPCDSGELINCNDESRRLYISRDIKRSTSALSPCDMNADEIDYEMSRGKNRQVVEIVGMTQSGLEQFVRHYGKEYRYISFFKSQLIRDFSPLADCVNLEAVSVYWNIRAEGLWDMSRNPKLRWLQIDSAKKLTRNLNLLSTASALESCMIGGGTFDCYKLPSLDCFAGMSNLKELRLIEIRIEQYDPDVLSTLPSLSRFDFDAGMLTTEQIAYLCARYPNLEGECMGAYSTERTIGDVRICGAKKPSLRLPEQQKALDRHIASFNHLVEMYRKQLDA